MKGYTKRLGIYVPLQKSISEYFFHKGPCILILQTNVNKKRDIFILRLIYCVFSILPGSFYKQDKQLIGAQEFQGRLEFGTRKKEDENILTFLFLKRFFRGVLFRYLIPMILGIFSENRYFILKEEKKSPRDHADSIARSSNYRKVTRSATNLNRQI